MPSGDQQEIRNWLAPGEKLLWSGRPCGGLRYERRDILRALLSLPLVGIPLYVVREALATRDSRREGIGAVSDATLTLIIAAAAIVMLLGLYRIFLGQLLDARRHSGLAYGLTGQRAIITNTNFPQFVRSIALESVTWIGIEKSGDGAGTISCRSNEAGWLYPQMHKVSAAFPLFKCIDFPLDVRFVRESPFAGPLFRHIDSPDQVIALLITMRPDLQVDAIAANTPDTITPSVVQ